MRLAAAAAGAGDLRMRGMGLAKERVPLSGRWPGPSARMGPVAQWITRLTTDQKIVGSTPAWLAYILVPRTRFRYAVLSLAVEREKQTRPASRPPQRASCGAPRNCVTHRHLQSTLGYAPFFR